MINLMPDLYKILKKKPTKGEFNVKYFQYSDILKTFWYLFWVNLAYWEFIFTETFLGCLTVLNKNVCDV